MTARALRAQRVRRPLILLLALIVLGAIFLAAVAYSSSRGTPGNSTTEAGVRYADSIMEWIHGPSIVHTRNTTLGQLPAVLPGLTTPVLRQDVNTRDLIRRFGSRRQVEVIVLSGLYNSLPPDEGVNIQGEVVVLVDLKTKKALFLTD